MLGSRPECAAGGSGDWALGPGSVAVRLSKFSPCTVSPNICTQNPSNSGLGVCSPPIEESHPSRPVLETVVRWTLSRVWGLAHQTPEASR